MRAGMRLYGGPIPDDCDRFEIRRPPAPSWSVLGGMEMPHRFVGSEGAIWLNQTRQRIEELERELGGAEAEIALRRSAIADGTVRA